MKKWKDKRIFLGIIVLIAVILPVFSVWAVDDYTLLAPLPCVGDGENCNTLANKTTLEKYLPGMFKLLITLAGVAAVLMIVIGGFEYMTTDAVLKKESGRKRIENAVLGLILVIVAWLILTTINPAILDDDKKTIKINLDIDAVTTTGTGLTGGGTLSGGARTATGADLLSGESLKADQEIRSQLKPVTVNNPPCTAQRTSHCTNLNGLPQSLITALKELQRACSSGGGGCDVQITGGTETSLHSAGTKHRPGNAVVDLASTATLNTYLGKPSPKSGDTAVKNGLVFVFEVTGEGGVSTGPHWHVQK